MSVYYSHVLQMLFFSYSQGKSFAATVNRSNMEMQRLFTINIKGYTTLYLSGYDVLTVKQFLAASEPSNVFPYVKCFFFKFMNEGRMEAVKPLQLCVSGLR